MLLLVSSDCAPDIVLQISTTTTNAKERTFAKCPLHLCIESRTPSITHPSSTQTRKHPLLSRAAAAASEKEQATIEKRNTHRQQLYQQSSHAIIFISSPPPPPCLPSNKACQTGHHLQMSVRGRQQNSTVFHSSHLQTQCCWIHY